MINLYNLLIYVPFFRQKKEPKKTWLRELAPSRTSTLLEQHAADKEFSFNASQCSDLVI